MSIKQIRCPHCLLLLRRLLCLNEKLSIVELSYFMKFLHQNFTSDKEAESDQLTLH